MLPQVPARVALAVTTLLAMSTTMASIQKSLPPVAYTKVCTYSCMGVLLPNNRVFLIHIFNIAASHGALKS